MNLLKNLKPNWSLADQQRNNIIFITFWSQFSTYALNTIIILFFIRSLSSHGLGYSQEKAYAFYGVSQATGYLMPVIGGFLADQLLGVRRAILLGTMMLAIAYLLIALSGYTLTIAGDKLFLAAYAMLPAANALLMGTASTMIVQVYAKDAILAKSAMTFYYMAINMGALLSTIISPLLFESSYGPLSVLILAFVGKALAAFNFWKKYPIYKNILWGKDKIPFSFKSKSKLIISLIIIYICSLLAFFYIYVANIIISIGCILGILWFFFRTLNLLGTDRSKQLIALLLILEAIIFFIIYNQMNTTLILFAKSNSDLNLLGFTIHPAQYQVLNPILIIMVGVFLPKFYRLFPRLTIPYQFSIGTFLAGCSLLLMAFAATRAYEGIINGNYIGGTYILITVAELLVSASGLSMIGLYCHKNMLAFAMGMWYLASSLSNTISGRLASFVAINPNIVSPTQSLLIYQKYYLFIGCVTICIAVVMFYLAYFIQRRFRVRGMVIS